MTPESNDPAPQNDSRAYRRHPQAIPNAPGVVLLHEIWGVDAHIRDLADRLAEAGYAVIAPDLFDMDVSLSEEMLGMGYRALMTVPPEERAVPGRVQAALESLPPRERDEFLRLMQAARGSVSEPGFRAIQSAVRQLKQERAAKVAVVGFCHGGRCVWAYAYAGGEADAFVPFYGEPSVNQVPNNVKAPLQGHFGGADHGILVAPVEEAAEQIRQQGQEATIHVYEGAPHAFFNDSRDTYHRPSAELAWSRLMSFLQRTLHGATVAT